MLVGSGVGWLGVPVGTGVGPSGNAGGENVGKKVGAKVGATVGTGVRVGASVGAYSARRWRIGGCLRWYLSGRFGGGLSGARPRRNFGIITNASARAGCFLISSTGTKVPFKVEIG